MLNGPASAPVSAHAEAVEPAGVRPGQQDPGDGAGVGRRDEGRRAPACATSPRPGMSVRDTAQASGTANTPASSAAPGAELQRVDQRLDVARAAVGGGVVGEGEGAGLLGLEAGDHQVDERAHHQEQQHRDDRDPQQPGRSSRRAPAQPLTNGARAGTAKADRLDRMAIALVSAAQLPKVSRHARSPRGCPCRSPRRSAGSS